jgi:hypothetical protein
MDSDCIGRPGTEHQQHQGDAKERWADLTIPFRDSAQFAEEFSTNSQSEQPVTQPAGNRLNGDDGAATKTCQHYGENTPRRRIVDAPAANARVPRDVPVMPRS